MKKINKIAIIGVGLIGGSIGLAARKKRVARQVIGVFRRVSTLKKALKRGAVDLGVMSIEDGVKGADLIILATPVCSIPALVKEAAKYAKTGAVITDAGSTKSWIVDSVRKSIGKTGRVNFIGSHPMAGSERTGVEAARRDLMQGSPCIVTKTRDTDKKALARVVGFWKALGAKVSVMSPSEHDANVALISHLPHIAAFGLAGAVPPDSLRYAAEGFKDTTRVASSDPELWADIFFTNRKEVIKASRVFNGYIEKITSSLSKGDYAGLIRLLKNAKSKRDKFIDGKK